MRISLQILIVVVVCLTGGLSASLLIWQHYQYYEREQGQHQLNQLAVRDIEHVSTMTSQWLITIDLFFGGSQSYLAKGITKQTGQLIATLQRIESQSNTSESRQRVSLLIDEMHAVRTLIEQASALRRPSGEKWRKLLAKSDQLTLKTIEQIEALGAAIQVEEESTKKGVATARGGLIQTITVSLLLYISVIVVVWRWATLNIARPLQKLTRSADKTTLEHTRFIVEREIGPREVRRLNVALQTLVDRLQRSKERAEKGQKEAAFAEKRIVSIMRTAADSIIITNITGEIEHINNATERLFDMGEKAIVHKNISEFIPELANKFKENEWQKYPNLELPLEMTARCYKGNNIPVDISIAYLNLEQEEKLTFIVRDIRHHKKQEAKIERQKQDLEHHLKELKNTRAQLIQSEKMAAVGQLAAGVAHEINNPVGFISSNISSLNNYIRDIKRLLEGYSNLLQVCEKNTPTEELKQNIESIYKIQEETGFKFIMEDLDELFKETIEGTERVKKIVGDLLEFSHVNKTETGVEDINELIDKSINVAGNELKYKIELEKQYGQLERIACNGGKLSQVFLILLVNAAQAIKDKGKITIRTHLHDDHIRLEFEDNGCGIPQRIIDKIYDPFFTTKKVGEGTGLGLNVAQNIIHKHKGEISVKSVEGEGTIFTITLPLHIQLKEEKQIVAAI